MTLGFIGVVLFIIFIDLLIIRAYQWNDDFAFYCNKALPGNCFCKTNDVDKNACYNQQKTAVENQLKAPAGASSTIKVK